MEVYVTLSLNPFSSLASGVIPPELSTVLPAAMP